MRLCSYLSNYNCEMPVIYPSPVENQVVLAMAHRLRALMHLSNIDYTSWPSLCPVTAQQHAP